MAFVDRFTAPGQRRVSRNQRSLADEQPCQIGLGGGGETGAAQDPARRRQVRGNRIALGKRQQQRLRHQRVDRQPGRCQIGQPAAHHRRRDQRQRPGAIGQPRPNGDMRALETAAGNIGGQQPRRRQRLRRRQIGQHDEMQRHRLARRDGDDPPGARGVGHGEADTGAAVARLPMRAGAEMDGKDHLMKAKKEASGGSSTALRTRGGLRPQTPF